MDNNIIFKDVLEEYFEKKEIPIYFFSMEERPKAKILSQAYSKNEQGCFFIPDSFYKPITRLVIIHDDGTKVL